MDRIEMTEHLIGRIAGASQTLFHLVVPDLLFSGGWFRDRAKSFADTIVPRIMVVRKIGGEGYVIRERKQAGPIWAVVRLIPRKKPFW